MAEPSAVPVSEKDAIIYRDAYGRREAEIRSVPDEELAVPNVEAQHALTSTLQGMPSISAMRPRLLALFTNYDTKPLDSLADYAMAYLHITTVNKAAAPQISPADALLSEGINLCNVIAADLEAAAARGAINGAPLKAAKGTAGYRNTADTLLLLAQVAHTNWSKLDGKTHITQTELRHAEVVAARINGFIADRAREEGSKTDNELQAQRAFTLFFRAHQTVRRDVGYALEREGKADQLEDIVPTIHNGRLGTKKRPEATAVLMFDVKGDLPNLLLTFPNPTAEQLLPWVEGTGSPSDTRTALERAAEAAEEHRLGLERWNVTPADVEAYLAKRSVRVITPGSSAGELLHVRLTWARCWMISPSCRSRRSARSK